MGHEKACIFRNTNITANVCLYVCMSERTVLWCVFSSLPVQHPNSPRYATPSLHFSCQKRQVLSAVRRSGDCWLGNHYKGHKRAIYRTTSEWSQHSPYPPGLHCAWVTNKKIPVGEHNDLNMKAGGCGSSSLTCFAVSNSVDKKGNYGTSRFWWSITVHSTWKGETFWFWHQTY